MKRDLLKGTLISLCLALGLGSGVHAATVDPADMSLTYKLAKGNKLVAQFDSQGDISSWWVITKPSKKFSAKSMSAKSMFAPTSAGFGDQVAGLLDDLGSKVAKPHKTQKNAVLAGLFGKTPPVLSWTRVSAEPIEDVIGGDVSPVPLPAGGLLLLSSLGGFMLLRRKKAI
jgi:hypothetical protein